MWPFTCIVLALVGGFFAGHGADLPVDLVPVIVAIIAGFLAIKATEQYSQR